MLAILLAAGKGRRAGGPKALLDLGGRTALDRCVGTLRRAGATRVRIVVSPAVAEALGGAPAGAELVVNPAPERGQTSSLRCALAGVDEDFLVHTVDHPLVRAEDVATLLAAFAGRAPGTLLTAPSVGGRRGHPCVHAAPLAAEFRALADDEPAHRVVRADPGRVAHVVLEDPWLVRDVDTPEDVADARAEAARRDAGPAA